MEQTARGWQHVFRPSLSGRGASASTRAASRNRQLRGQPLRFYALFVGRLSGPGAAAALPAFPPSSVRRRGRLPEKRRALRQRDGIRRGVFALAGGAHFPGPDTAGQRAARAAQLLQKPGRQEQALVLLPKQPRQG